MRQFFTLYRFEIKKIFQKPYVPALLALCIALTVFLNVRPLLGEQTVAYVDDMGQIGMNWDNGSSLSLMPSLDSFSKEPELKREKKRSRDLER